MDALIGHTGFVGSTLLRQGWSAQALFNSTNIGEMRDGRFGTVVCAGVSAVKWKANQKPEADEAGIARLWDVLQTISADRLILISTIDVYPEPLGVTEADAPPDGSGQPYGRHRLALERRLAARFPHAQVVRLPGLFGTGLRKNLIFDLLTGNMLDRISPNGVFQWYPMRRLADDLGRVGTSGIPLLNLAVEPVATSALATALFPGVAIGAADMPAARYDMRTLHPGVLGGAGCYHIDAATVMEELAAYVAQARRAGSP